jgi:protein-disulfide isomerase
VLERWIEEHREVNWEWWNLPLAMHDPMASGEAQLAECVGEMDGNQAFWRTVAWLYRHTRGDGAGIPSGTRMSEKSRAVSACLDATKAAKVIRSQAEDASRLHIMGTPTLRILDHKTGRAFDLQGPVAGDSLLSAIDSLAATGSHQ